MPNSTPAVQTMPLMQDEIAAGKPADFVVFYTRNGKRYKDPVYAPDAASAQRKFTASMKFLGWKFTEPRMIVRPAVA